MIKNIIIVGIVSGLILLAFFGLNAECITSKTSDLTLSNIEALSQIEGGSGEKIFITIPEACVAPSEIYIIDPGYSVFQAEDWLPYSIQTVQILVNANALFTVFPQGPGVLKWCDDGTKLCFQSPCHHVPVY